MIQYSNPLPAGMAVCVEGHHPQLVESRGAPSSVRGLGAGAAQWHVECFQCGIATVPTTHPSLALMHWRSPPDLFHIPLIQLPRVRERMAAAVAAA